MNNLTNIDILNLWEFNTEQGSDNFFITIIFFLCITVPLYPYFELNIEGCSAQALVYQGRH